MFIQDSTCFDRYLYRRFINTFATFTIVIALIHFVLETLYTIKFGQTWAGLLPDYIAVTLMCVGGLVVLKNIKAAGVLCGAWGFAFCLHYRSWAWRFGNNGYISPRISSGNCCRDT